jgi:hypothetical protein
MVAFVNQSDLDMFVSSGEEEAIDDTDVDEKQRQLITVNNVTLPSVLILASRSITLFYKFINTFTYIYGPILCITSE